MMVSSENRNAQSDGTKCQLLMLMDQFREALSMRKKLRLFLI